MNLLKQTIFQSMFQLLCSLDAVSAITSTTINLESPISNLQSPITTYQLPVVLIRPSHNHHQFSNPLILSIKLPRHHRHLQLADRLCDVNIARTGVRAVIRGVTSHRAVRFAQNVQAFRCALIAAIEDEAMRRHQRGGTVVFLARPERRT